MVRGLRFPDSSLLACRFGEAIAAARWVNATELECEAPAVDTAQLVTVEVSANGADFTADGAAFSYAATATVTGAVPASGPATGGTEVVVRGANLVFSSSLACRFAFFDVPASFVSPTELRCAAPAQSAGSAAFAVVDDRRVLYESSFEYTPLMAVRAAGPPRGAAGTTVTVAGSGFAAYATAECAFGDVRVAAAVRSDTEITCDAPPGEGAVAVRVVSGGTTAAGEATFAYARAPSAASLRPSAGVAGEPVTVYGADFVDASELACAFGDVRADARYVSSTELVCLAPTANGTVDVRVTVNGFDFGPTAAAFTHAREATKRFAPATGPAKGGTEVVIVGADFAPSARLACRFGAAVVPASFMDEETVACVSPRGAGDVVLSISRDGVAFAKVGSFAYHPLMTLEGLEPPLGSVRGTTLTLRGRDLPSQCLFGDVLVRGTRTDGGVACQAPPTTHHPHHPTPRSQHAVHASPPRPQSNSPSGRPSLVRCGARSSSRRRSSG